MNNQNGILRVLALHEYVPILQIPQVDPDF